MENGERLSKIQKPSRQEMARGAAGRSSEAVGHEAEKDRCVPRAVRAAVNVLLSSCPQKGLGWVERSKSL